jgi:uroporphyrinogen-III synthase
MQEVERMRVVSLESRRAADMTRLLERHGCEPISAPSMREVPLTDQHEAFAFGETLLAGGCDAMVLLTGVGTRMLVEALSTRWPHERVLEALGKLPLACRGPKPVAVLKQLGLKPSLVAPEPNTWEDLLAEIDRALPVRGLRLFVQEYGRPSPQLLAGLRERGADVRSVSVYGWAMPEDTAPLTAAIDRLARRDADAVLFTSGQQAEHLLGLARERGHEAALAAALREHVLCVSIGPVTSDALRDHQLPIDLEPIHPKMGHMVTALAKEGPQLLVRKRAALRG